MKYIIYNTPTRAILNLYACTLPSGSVHINPHCKNKIVKITNLLVSTVALNSGNCNLIGRIDFYGYTRNYNLIVVISISLSCIIDA